MNTTEAEWIEKRKAGFVRYMFWDGIVIVGGPFAVIMQVIGYFFLRDEGQTVVEYFSSTRMWTTFFLHATLFGGIMGIVKWRRNEKAFASRNTEG